MAYKGDVLMHYNLKKAFTYIFRYLMMPVLLEIIIESLSRKSLISGIGYMFSSPVLFSFNALIIMLTLSVALFFKREIFVFITVAVVWLCFGVANFVILHFRVTPFSAVDFYNDKYSNKCVRSLSHGFKCAYDGGCSRCAGLCNGVTL